MTSLIDKLRKLFALKGTGQVDSMNQLPAQQGNATARLDEQSLVRLMQLVEQTQEGHYSCAETFDLLDEYVELVVNNQEAELLLPIVKRHIDLCPGCHDKYEILLNILQTDT
jgi:hypothetical protein